MDSTADPLDCIVTGSGPAGMIAALQAAKAGLSVLLVGPQVNLDDKRTTAILGPSLDDLADLGLGDHLEAIGTPLDSMRLLDGSRRLVRAPAIAFDAEEIGRASFGLNCPNGALNQVLHDAVEASPAITRKTGLAVAYTLNDGTVEITADDGSVHRAKALIAADGKNSPARKAAGISVRRWPYPQTAAVGLVTHDQPHHNISTEFHTETGPFTFVPMPDVKDADGSVRHQSSFVCALAPETADELAAMDLKEASRFLEKRSLHLFGGLSLRAPVQLWPLEALVAGTFAAKGVFLIGETAHAFPPIGAQGLNLSIRDAGDAVDVIAGAIHEGRDPASRLIAARYSAKRRADVWSRTLGVDALNRSLLSDNPLTQVARAAAMGAARFSPRLKQGLMVAGLQPLSMQTVIDTMRQLAPGIPAKKARAPIT